MPISFLECAGIFSISIFTGHPVDCKCGNCFPTEQGLFGMSRRGGGHSKSNVWKSNSVKLIKLNPLIEFGKLMESSTEPSLSSASKLEIRLFDCGK